MKTTSSQIRIELKEADHLILTHIDQHFVIGIDGVRQEKFPVPREAVLFNLHSRERELWIENDDFAGYVIVIDGKGFEFVRSA